MTTPEANGKDNLPHIIFERLTEMVGPLAVRSVIEHGKANIQAGRVGAVVSDPEADWQMSVTKDGVYFKLGNWGPYGVSDSEAAAVLNQFDPPKS